MDLGTRGLSPFQQEIVQLFGTELLAIIVSLMSALSFDHLPTTTALVLTSFLPPFHRL